MSYSSYSGSHGYSSYGYSSYDRSNSNSRSFGRINKVNRVNPVPASACTAKAPVSPMELVTIQRPSISLKWPTLYPGQKVYMTAGIRVEPVTFLRSIHGQCQVRTEGGGNPMVWRRRLFTTMEEAESFLPGNCVCDVPEGKDTDDNIGFDLESPFPEEISYNTETEESWPLFEGGPSSPGELFSGKPGNHSSSMAGESHTPDEIHTPNEIYRSGEYHRPGEQARNRPFRSQPWRNGSVSEPGDGWARR